MSTQDRIRQAALDAGWTIKARKGDEIGHAYGHQSAHARWDRDIFVIGRIERNLADGTPVVEPEHHISVWYRRDGAVRFAGGHTFTVAEVVYRRGIMGTRREGDKADRIIAALAARTSDIPVVPA